MPRAPLIVLLVLTLTPLAGCDVTGQVERAIERELPRIIGPADTYVVSIEGLRASAGTAERVHVLGQRVRPEEAPVIEQLDLTMERVQIDRQAQRIERVEAATAVARVTPTDLASFLSEHRNVRDAVITLQAPDQATIRLRPTVAGLSLPQGVTVEVTGRVVAEAGEIVFDVDQVRAAGAALGSAAARAVTGAINPLVDLTDLPAELRVTDVAVEDGRLLVHATGDPSGITFR